MFEQMETPIKQVRGEVHASLLQGFQHLGDMFCRMGEVQNTERIRPMPLAKHLAPVCPIHHSANFLCLPYLAPSRLHFRQLGKG